MLARQKLGALEVDQGSITEKTLHQFRIAGKRARYIAELAGKNAEATRLVELLNHMQDVIGDWHDWMQLAERAEKMFGGVQDSALVAALRNITRAKFRQAVNTLTETRTALAGKKPVSVISAARAALNSRSLKQPDMCGAAPSSAAFAFAYDRLTEDEPTPKAAGEGVRPTPTFTQIQSASGII